MPSESDLRRSESDVVAQGKIHAERPTWDALKAQFGSAFTVTETPDGKLNGRLVDRTPDRRHMKALSAMGRRSKQMESDLGREVHGRSQTETLRGPDGSIERIPVQVSARAAKRRGLRAVVRWGKPSRPGPRGLWANGHTHLGDPLPWVRARCPGCQHG
jgi:hypothetical protein